MSDTITIDLHHDIVHLRLTIARRSKFGKRGADVNVGTIRLAVRVEEVQMMPGAIGPTGIRVVAVAVGIKRKRFARMATMVVLGQNFDIDLARSSVMHTAQIHNKHAIHENPHVIVTGEFEHFVLRSLVGLLVLEARITHHRKGVVTEMLHTDCQVIILTIDRTISPMGCAIVRSGKESGTIVGTTDIDRTRAAIREPVIAKGVRAQLLVICL